MTRIFQTLAILSTLATLVAFALGWSIGDAAARASAGRVNQHLLTGLAALLFCVMVHAIVLTYFMGTGRWLEETCQAYQLPPEWHAASQSLKYRTLPWMGLCLLALIATGAFGAAADPASAVGFRGWGDLSGGTIHMLVALGTWGLNLVVFLAEYGALVQNGEIVQKVLAEVRRIRVEKGLPV